MFGISNVPDTPRNRIAALIAIVLGLGVGFYFAVSGDKDESDVTETVEETSETEIGLEGPVITDFVPPEIPTPPKPLRLEDIDFSTYSESMAKFTGLEVGQSRVEAIDNIRLYFAPEEGDTIIQTSQSTFDREDGSVMVFGASGLADDSVKAEELFLILTGPEGAQTLQAFGSKIKCHRGDNTTEWQITNCP